jgi:hypothetical protein
MATFRASKLAYDDWLKQRLGDDLVKKDLSKKSEDMKESAFVFLRATYWRWAEVVLEVCPELANAPVTLAVGDIHLENFGTWRDAEGRLVFGVNDFDEAAEMPYALDLVRLATSALLGAKTQIAADSLERALVHGYGCGLAVPRPIILDKDHGDLREYLVVSNKKRKKFWDEIEAREKERAPPRFHSALEAAMPEPGLAFDTARRRAGTGSLGRPRWIGVAHWQGGPVVREAKALLASGWHLASGKADAVIEAGRIAAGRFRSPDPWYSVAGGVVVRRLSPNNRKVEAGNDLADLNAADLHEVMGRELAALHIGANDTAAAIGADLKKRHAGWIADAAQRCAKAVTDEFKVWVAAT